MIKINLLPRVEEFEKVPVQIYGALALVIVGVLALGYWYWDLTGQKATADEQVAALQLRNQELQAIQARIQELEATKKNTEDRIAIIEQLQRNQRGPVQLMNEVIASVPSEPGLWLNSLVQRDTTVTIEGRAFDVPFIADFIATLSNSPSFRFVELQFWEQDAEDTIRFRLHCETQERQAEETPQ
jgi:Tfp pilus assembly protein PilN